jgi:type I restriction-modification system DNA methylase subunit
MSEINVAKNKLENQLKILVDKYHANRNNYIKPAYNETQLRTDFLDPFFSILGWDINNTGSKPTNEREVLLEEALKENASSNTKKPDYTFRLFSERKFFLEAKKPNVKIETENNPAKQVRRYGFTAKLKISVLSNFEYLAIYDCSQKVQEDDQVQKSRIKLYHYTEYVDAIEDILLELGRESVYKGKFDEHWKEIENQIKLSSVDHLFLEQINNWRLVLGNEIFSHNNAIPELELNDIVQSYINSIIFLRVCEDRNIETYKTLLSYADAKDFKALIKKFSEADKKFNAGLFSQKYTNEIITNSSSAFWKIINQLYFPESTFSFSVFASDILGNIYEVFLAEQLKIHNSQIILEKKPEHVDRDIVTTPTHIIQDILRQTVQKYTFGKTDKEILNSTFADIACGSGAFLLETYQLLHDVLVDYYLINEPEKLIHKGINSYKLPYFIKVQLLTQCIYGIDRDFNAVQACKFGLLLKLLEGEDNNSIPTPALPSLDTNISFGNSLISPENTPENSIEEINPFDFNDIKFDVVIGNPPYMATEHMKQLTPTELPLYKANYISAFKQFDKYFLFIERAIELLKPSGYFGYIIPSKFVKVGAGKKLRQLLTENKIIHQIISFGANQIFYNKTTYTCLLILQKKEQEKLQYLEIHNLNDWKTRNISEDDFDNVDFSELEEDGWSLVPGNLKTVYQKISEQSIILSDLLGSDNIFNGIQTSANNIYIHSPTSEDEHFYYFTKSGIDWKIEKKLTRPYFKTVSGTDSLNTYRPFSPNTFVIYPYIKSKNVIEFVDIETLKNDYPFTFTYLNHYKAVLSNPKRDIKPTPETENEWYRYGRHQSLDKCDVPAKIIVGVLSQGDKYAIDFHGTLISSGGTAGYCMVTLPKECQYSIYYIQALLNSKYLEWFSAINGEVYRGGYIARGTKVLKKLPIRVIDFKNELEKNKHDTISRTQKSLITLQGDIDKASGNLRKLVPLQRQFKALKSALEEELKELYSIGEDDEQIPLIAELYEVN